MDPRELIELMIVVSVVAVILIISLLLKGKLRRFSCVLALGILIAYGIFYVARPFWIDVQINKKVEILRPYLEQRFPNEKWVIQTVPHREKDYKSHNPYYISVVFENEPDVTYDYWVESKNNVYTVAYSEKTGYSSEHKHLIRKK